MTNNQELTPQFLDTTMTSKSNQLVNLAKRACANIRINSCRLACIVKVLIDGNHATRDELCETLEMSNASITRFYKAGTFYYNHRDMLDVEYSKAYMLAHAESRGTEINAECAKMTQKEIRELLSPVNDKKSSIDNTDNEESHDEAEKNISTIDKRFDIDVLCDYLLNDSEADDDEIISLFTAQRQHYYTEFMMRLYSDLISEQLNVEDAVLRSRKLFELLIKGE